MTVKTNFRAALSRFRHTSDAATPKRTSPRRRRLLWIVLPILVLAAAGGYAYYRLVYMPAQTALTTTAMQTSVARTGDLVLYASGTGTLISASESNLAFKTGGQVSKIAVAVGDTVKAGDLLAEVDDTSAQIAYTQARRALAELTSPAAIAEAQTSLADAEAEIDSARSQLEYV
ncbi:MAG: biotin/lipoyl-binding protein, partial [Bacteroidota bacterium]